jgi:hypothetical protein
MAKELPYFKFEPAEYLTKDVSFALYSGFIYKSLPTIGKEAANHQKISS